MSDDLRALIIGGGIAGMSAAIALREAGIPVDLCERDPQWKVYGAGITITGPTLRAMGSLGILDEVLEQGSCSDGIDVCAADGKPMFSIDTRDPTLGGIPSAGGILRPTLHRILSNRLLPLSPNLMLGVTAERIVDQGPHVDVSFSDGRKGRYDFVVAADGIYSQTRQQFFPEVAPPRYVGQVCWRLMMPRHPGITRRTFFLGGPAKVGLNPIAPDIMYMFYVETTAAPVWHEPDKQHVVLADLLQGYGGILKDVRERLGPASEIVARPLEAVFAGENWARGRILLIGDAAHATTPQLASGAGMGIEDGLVLGEEFERERDVRHAFTSFMKRRYQRSKLVVESSLEISRLERECSPPQAQTKIVEETLAVLNQHF